MKRARRRRVSAVAIASAAIVAVLCLLWSQFGETLIRDAYAGKSFEVLNRFIAGHRAINPTLRTESYYVSAAPRAYGASAFLGFTMFFAYVAFELRHGVARFYTRFLFEPLSPFNLAFLRITTFGVALWALAEHGGFLVHLAGMPPIVRKPEWGLGMIHAILPFSPARIELASAILIVACISGILGFCSRISALVAFLCALYVFGSYSAYGAARHIFHVATLSLAVLACSRCGDVLALDAVLPAFRRADRGVVRAPDASAAYGLPVKIVWHIFALAYFFPGIWKLLLSGPEYVFGYNVRNIAWAARTGVEGFVPLMEPESLPLMSQLMGVATLAWEIGFFFAIFFPVTRLMAITIGQAFHTSTIFLLGIKFVYMQTLYAWFLPWDAVFKSLGRTLFREDLRVAYDDGCGPCRRTIAVLAAFDLFRRITFIPISDRATLDVERLGHLSPETLAENMHAGRGAEIASGYDAYRWIAARIPVLWPLRAVMDLPPVAAVGRRIYRKVADSRACRIARPPLTSPLPASRFPIVTAACGVAICGGMVYAGALKRIDAFPIACFPTFSGPIKTEIEFVDRRLLLKDGSEVPYRSPGLDAKIGEYHRGIQIDSVCNRLVLRDGIEDKLPDVIDYWTASDPLPDDARALRIYRNRISTKPEDKADRILEERLFYQFDFDARIQLNAAPRAR